MDRSWEFKGVRVAHLGSIGPSLDKANGCKTLKEVYGLGRGGYDGRSTVPMLWDKGKPELDLSRPELKEEIEEWYRIIYPNVNNGIIGVGLRRAKKRMIDR
ncbi:uncharacterized protein LOC108325875 isoform X1 [Vigna angularis]|uniref:uncharacterized protein LOC108325875 isoform X1 n=1 Tax=Phaseolus angularis TaxID=3914 RepID=UPI000809DF94|nr:uncharacterized protein LOC108325875 isoform X1 [Vigna angularis]